MTEAWHCIGLDGIELRGEAHGNPGAPPVVLLHGGGQTRGAWDGAACAVAERGYRAIAIDLRGHGESEWSADGDYGIDAFSGDVIRVVRALSRPPVIIGASLGGIAAMVAEARGRIARALVLVDIAPRIETTGVARIVGFMSAHPAGFANVEEAADAIAAYLPDRPRPRDLSGLRRNLRQNAHGRLSWHWDPRFLDERRGPRNDDVALLHAAASQLAVPTLLVRGARSDLLSEAGAQEFLALVPHARFVDVAGAGHMVAGDRNDAFTSALLAFLAELDCPGPQLRRD